MHKQLKNKNLYVMVLGDAAACSLAMLFAYLFRFDFYPESRYWMQIPYLVSLAVPIKLTAFWWLGLYRGMWRYTDIFDFWRLFQATFFSSLLVIGIVLLVHRFEGFPRSVFFIDGLLTLVLCGGLRIGVRTLYRSKENLHLRFFLPWAVWEKKRHGQIRVLLIGAGDAGEKILREMIENPALNFDVLGFLDDAQEKHGRSLHGVPVLGGLQELSRQIGRLHIDQVFIAMPSATGAQMRRIVDACEQAKVTFKTLPGLGEIMDGRVSVSHLREVQLEDLLGRESVDLDTAGISQYVHDRVVLVSGAGGSIGSELCRQLVHFQPRQLILVDASELNLYTIEMDLRCIYHFQAIKPVLGHIQDAQLMQWAFATFTPEVVFHAAAYKHVPMLEANPWEAVDTNIRGSSVLMQTAQKYQVKRFVMVSTDKAVRPTNVMGASKRTTELLMHAQNGAGPTRFMAVRFGNVVGSSGSVIPLFQRQIRQGGPVTVTHPEVTRYFMTIPEAAQLIIQAGALGQGGEIFILDMGTPIKISDMARDLIKLMGKEPDTDIEITYTGLRPGEKLYEELSTHGENTARTRHRHIMVLKASDTVDALDMQEKLHHLYIQAQAKDEARIRKILQELVPEYYLQIARPSSPTPQPPDPAAPGSTKSRPGRRC